MSPVQPERCWPLAVCARRGPGDRLDSSFSAAAAQLPCLKSTTTAQISLDGNSYATVDAPRVYREHSGMPGMDGMRRRSPSRGIAVTGWHSWPPIRNVFWNFGSRHRVLATPVNACMQICIAWFDCSSTNRTRGGSGDGEHFRWSAIGSEPTPAVPRRDGPAVPPVPTGDAVTGACTD
jgi:hypothetical protein